MTPRLYHLLTAALFALVALLHAARLAFGWPAVIGGWAVPLGLSWAGLLVAGFLAGWGFRLGRG